MAAKSRSRLLSTVSLSTIYSHDEVDTLEVSDRQSDDVEGAEIDTEVFTSSTTASDVAAAPADDQPTQPPTERHHLLRRTYAVVADNATLPVIDDVAAHSSAHLHESAETSQVPVQCPLSIENVL